MRIGCMLFSLLLLTGLLISSSHAIDAKSIIGIWRLDEGQGEVTKDSSGNGLDGTLMNGPKWVSGKSGKGLKFDGLDDVVEIPNNGLPEQYTVCLWIYPETEENMAGGDGQYGRSIFTSSNDPPGKYGVWVTIDLGKNVRFYAFEDIPGLAANSFLTDSDPISVNKWNHVAVTAINGGDSHVYVNGKDEGSFTNAGKAGVTSEAYYLGDLRAGRKIAFMGIIDEVVMFDTVLSAAEIGTVMSRGLNSLTAVEPSDKLAATWAEIKSSVQK